MHLFQHIMHSSGIRGKLRIRFLEESWVAQKKLKFGFDIGDTLRNIFF